MNVVNVNLEGYKKVWDELSVCDERGKHYSRGIRR